MYSWKNTKGDIIYFYNHDHFKWNFLRTNSWKYCCFSDWWTERWSDAGKAGYIATEDFDIQNYANNFIQNLPENAVLYFDKNSNFPRAKLSITDYKRTIKPENANAIVLGSSATVKCINEIYHIFTDAVNIFAIKDEWFKLDFNSKFDDMKSYENILNIKFHDNLRLIYSGPIKIVNDPTDTIKMFNDKKYDKPFILDECLDKIVNQYLPDPDLKSLLSIKEMLYSSDRNMIKLGAIMAAGFNISKWPLTFRVLLGLNTNWIKPENGGNTVTIKQMQDSLKVESKCGGKWYLASLIQSLKENYSEQDILLSQDLVRTFPDVKDFCKMSQKFYLDALPFIPDEYKI